MRSIHWASALTELLPVILSVLIDQQLEYTQSSGCHAEQVIWEWFLGGKELPTDSWGYTAGIWGLSVELKLSAEPHAALQSKIYFKEIQRKRENLRGRQRAG